MGYSIFRYSWLIILKNYWIFHELTICENQFYYNTQKNTYYYKLSGEAESEGQIFVYNNPTIKFMFPKQFEQSAILNAIPLHIPHCIYFVYRGKEQFETDIYIFIKKNLHAAISDKNFAAASSITASACSRDTEGNPSKNSSKELSSR